MGLSINIIERKEISSFQSGSYSCFGIWRKKLASLVDIDLVKMDGFGGKKEWKENTPFIELLNHSDCEGSLTYSECEELKEDFENKDIIKNVNDTKISYFIESFNEWKKAILEVLEDEDREIEFK